VKRRQGARLPVGQEGAEPVRAGRRPRKASLFQEWTLRNPPAYRGAERANGRPGNSGEPSRPRRLRGGGKRCPAYNRRTREVAVGGRAAVGAGRSTPRSGKPAAWGRARASSMHGKDERDLMCAVSARSVSRTVGVDRVRALQRVLYRCAKQDRDRRFMPSMTRSPAAMCSGRRGEYRAASTAWVGDFLDELATQLRAGTYRPRPLRRPARAAQRSTTAPTGP
jgi:hypothetical protein